MLEKIPQDGTFDQPAPLERLDSSNGLWSFDLTAATDRLPIRLQVHLLASLLGSQSLAEKWAILLTKRAYGFFQLGYSAFAGIYKYAVGQPMGALSSWAMLALTHHFLVQVAA